MARKKVNQQIINLLENCIAKNHRSMVFIMGKKSRYQVVILYHLLLKSLSLSKCSVLWCFQNDLGFSKHNDKRIRQLKKQYRSGDISMTENESLFDHFLVATHVQYCHYSDTDTILGQTHKIAVLQDFDALTPNIIARITETVEGGGMIIFILPNLTSLDQLANHKMYVHTSYATEAYPSVSLRFNNRFVLSLRSCKNCLVLTDDLKEILSSSKLNSEENPQSYDQMELLELKQSQADVKYVKKIINQCCTSDQAKALLIFYNSLLEKHSHSVTSLTSARGRGKSSTLGLSVALALALKYSNIFVTSPHVENLGTLFTFLIMGLQLLKYKENIDYSVAHTTNEDGIQFVSKIEVFKSHHQVVKYILPSDFSLLHNADLIIIDEAAAIPLPFVKKWIGPFSIFMASTINGYEGTGRSLSLKLISHLRKQSSNLQNKKNSISSSSSFIGHSLIEVSLNQPIRYNENDAIEAWLNNLLCLDATVTTHISGASPDPQQCQLYYVNRDTLFSYHTAAEKFLQNTIALFVSSHYKNSPNDLLMLADAPTHHIFCLLPPFEENFSKLPNILCVIQVVLEGRISKPVIVQDKSRGGKRGAGELIPSVISQQFLDDDFPSYSGARIIRIATHPEFQKLGYGLRALEILCDYYKGSFISSNEKLKDVPSSVINLKNKKEPVKNQNVFPHLLLRLQEREPEMLDYVGVSYGLTYELLRFWKKSGFVPLYVRQTQNEVTGEHSCVMIKELSTRLAAKKCLFDYWLDFSGRFSSLLSSAFRNMPVNLAFAVLTNAITKLNYAKEGSTEELNIFVSSRSKNRLKLYSNNQIDYHLIMDLLPVISRLYFNRQLDLTLPNTQAEILLCLGLQCKSVEDAAKELNLQATEVMGLLTQILKKVVHSLNNQLKSHAHLNEKGRENEMKSFPLKNQAKLEYNGMSNFSNSKHMKNIPSFKRQMEDSNFEDVLHNKTKKSKMF